MARDGRGTKKESVSLFSSRAAALVSRVSRLRRSSARALFSLNLKKKRDCSQSSDTIMSPLVFFTEFQELFTLDCEETTSEENNATTSQVKTR